MFWLTGSQQFRLMQGVSESLAGRVAIVNLAGLTLAEAHGKGGVAAPFVPTPSELQRRREVSTPLTLAQIYSIIWHGSLPAIALNPAVDHALFYGSYTQTYLQRDVRDLARVGDEAAFLRFLRATAARTGSLLNLSDLARDVDIAHNTARSWLSILESSGIVYLLEPFYTNLSKRLVKAPKLYFLDTGLAAYLTGWGSPETLEAGAMSGAFFESWVVGELLKSFWHAARTPQLFYYRDRDQREIDVLFMQDGVTYPLEIKKTASPKPDDVRHFQALERLGLRVGPGALVCRVEP